MWRLNWFLDLVMLILVILGGGRRLIFCIRCFSIIVNKGMVIVEFGYDFFLVLKGRKWKFIVVVFEVVDKNFLGMNFFG